MDNVERIKELVQLLNKACYAYYQEDNPFLTDKQYDELYDELEALEKETGIVMANSPTQKVQGFLLDSLKKVKHTVPMLSANKTKDMNEIKKFIGNRSVLCSFKLDGLTLVTRYYGGKFVQAITRGNGEVGEDVTEQAKMIINLPMQIPFDGDLELRGECVISWDNFRKINESLEVVYSHPRNLASGSIRQLDTNIVKQRNLEYIVFDLVTFNEFEFYNQALYWIDSLGFTTVDRIVVPSPGCEESPCFNNSIITDSLNDADEYLSADRSKYPIDGQIYEYDNLKYGKSLGSTAHHNNNMLARKWTDCTYETTLKDIEWTMGQTGILTPTAVFEPVEIDGTIVERASLHNVSIMKELELSYGDTVTVYKANMVIPQVDDNLDRSLTDVCTPPGVCPICGGNTKIIKENNSEVLFCDNPDCPGKLLGKLKLFVSKESMNVDGLSEATLQIFINKGWVKDISDIYSLYLHEEELQKMKGFGKRSVSKLLNAIEASRSVTMANFIRSLGIPLIGKVQAKALSDFCNGDIEAFDKKIINSVDFGTNIEGFGEKRNKSIYDWFSNEDNIDIYYKLRKEVTFIDTDNFMNPPEDDNRINLYKDLHNQTFCISGKLNHFANRDELVKKIEFCGGKYVSSVSSKLDWLINNDTTSTSGKNKKMHELGKEDHIISEEDFLKMIGV